MKIILPLIIHLCFLSTKGQIENIKYFKLDNNKVIVDVFKPMKGIKTQRVSSSSFELIDDKFFRLGNEKVYIKPEKFAIFPGGKEALDRFIRDNINLTNVRLEFSNFPCFILNEKGYIEDIGIFKGGNSFFDLKAIELVKKMPKWQPAYNKGKPVKCFVTVKVHFKRY